MGRATHIPLLQFSERGIYCQRAGVFIDPWAGVPKAVITHAHSDHARPGSRQYLCTPLTKELLRLRFGNVSGIESMDYGETRYINGVKFSLYPAGHMCGSAQVRIEYAGEVGVVSGDYKIDKDNISEPFEQIPCHTFVTESTFGLPVYQWPDPQQVFQDINRWWAENSAAGMPTIISAYAMGKAQRLIQGIDHTIGPVYCHESIDNVNATLRSAGVPIPGTRRLESPADRHAFKHALVVIPGSVSMTSWTDRPGAYATGAVSGWMLLRGRKRWQNVDRGFVLSDHADWPALNHTVRATGCERAIVTHGYSAVFARWLRENGLPAYAEQTPYEGETE